MIVLRPVQPQDIKYFARWWRDPDLIRVTSGDTVELTDHQVARYFKNIFESQTAQHFMVDCDFDTIGHISLQKRANDWWETQIILGEKKSRGKGYGLQAIRQLLDEAKTRGISKIYLEVRPENVRAIRAYQKAGFKRVGKMINTLNKLQPQLVRMELG